MAPPARVLLPKLRSPPSVQLSPLTDYAREGAWASQPNAQRLFSVEEMGRPYDVRLLSFSASRRCEPELTDWRNDLDARGNAQINLIGDEIRVRDHAERGPLEVALHNKIAHFSAGLGVEMLLDKVGIQLDRVGDAAHFEVALDEVVICGDRYYGGAGEARVRIVCGIEERG